MKHLPRVPGRMEAMCGGEFPATTADVRECDCRGCLWGLALVTQSVWQEALHRLRAMDAPAVPSVRGKK